MLDPAQTLLIANPNAAAGRVGRSWPTLEAQLRARLGPIEMVRTRAPRDASQLATAAIRAGKRTLLSLGGDGTHSEVADGIRASGAAQGAVTLGILPAGTGGDFKRMLSGDGTLLTAATRLQSQAEAAPIDLGVVRCVGEDGSPVERALLNLGSFGLSAHVSGLANRSSKRFGGLISYLVATLRALAQYQAPHVELHVDGSPAGRFLLCSASVANGQYAGGGMHFAPQARLADGLLDITVLHQQSLWAMLGLTAAIYGGRILSARGVTGLRGRTVSAHVPSGEPVGVEVDGEVIGRLPVEFTLLPRLLRLLDVRPDAL